MRANLGPPWTDSHPIWAVDVFHHAPPAHGVQNTEIQKKFFVTSSLLYSITQGICYRGFIDAPAGQTLINADCLKFPRKWITV